MRLIDADVLNDAMYHEAFETDSEMQKWDSGCWIRYKMFENHLEETPTVKTKEVKYFDEDEKAWKIGSVIVDTPQIDCRTCRHNKSGCYEKGSLSCERCCGTNFEFYEPKDESKERSE